MGRKTSNKRGPSQARTGSAPPPKVEAAPPRAYSEAEQAAIDARGALLTDVEVRNRIEALRNAQ